MTYEELSVYGRLRKIFRCGPVSMFKVFFTFKHNLFSCLLELFFEFFICFCIALKVFSNIIDLIVLLFSRPLNLIILITEFPEMSL